MEIGAELGCCQVRTVDGVTMGRKESRPLQSVTLTSTGSMQRSLRPLFAVMALVGHYRFPNKTAPALSILPGVLLIIISWLDCIRIFFIYKPDVTHIMTVALIHIITTSIAITSTQAFLYLSSQFATVTDAWDNYRHSYPHADLAPRRYAEKALIAYTIFNVCTLVFALSSYILVPDICKLILMPFIMPEYTLSMRVFCGLVHTGKAVLYYVPVTGHLVVCAMIGAEFEAVRASLQSQIERSQDTISDWMEAMRKRHLTLCGVVQKADAVVSPIILCAVALDIPIVVLHVFAVAGDAIEVEKGLLVWQAYIVPYSCVIATLHLIALTVCCAYVTQKGKSVALQLYDIRMKHVNEPTRQSIMAFLHYVNYEHIGFTAWRVIDMDNRAMVTIFSLVVSYVCVMVHFATVAGGSDAPAHDINTVIGNTTLPDS